MEKKPENPYLKKKRTESRRRESVGRKKDWPQSEGKKDHRTGGQNTVAEGIGPNTL